MKFRPTPLNGAYVIELERREDDRGFFARAFCKREFEQTGLIGQVVQANSSQSKRRGTLRGLHYQLPADSEVKFVRCIRGSLFDVIVDLRPHSSSYRRWFGEILSESNRSMMYVPQGFAHGFLTLEDNVEALYLVSAFYAPERERGLRFDDPALDIDWPLLPLEMSEKDRAWPHFDPEFHGVEAFRELQ